MNLNHQVKIFKNLIIFLGLEDHIIALKDLETILKIDANNLEIKKMYEDLKSFVQNENIGQKKVFKSFFRKINENEIYNENNKKEKEITQGENINENNIANSEVEDNNTGKPELKILNL